MLLIIIIIIIYFENVHFFHDKLRLDVCPYEVPPHIPEYCPFRLQTKHFHITLHTLSPSLPIPPLHLTPARLPPPHFYRLTPNHPHTYAPNATTLICHASISRKSRSVTIRQLSIHGNVGTSFVVGCLSWPNQLRLGRIPGKPLQW